MPRVSRKPTVEERRLSLEAITMHKKHSWSENEFYSTTLPLRLARPQKVNPQNILKRV